MKHMQADKYTIAWFKIADYVSRGEKERALGVYRLLSHSFNDDAVARQLEGDIYFSCNEIERAIFFYRQAIELYQKSKRFIEAAAICEHLIIVLPQDILLRREVILCYNNIKLASKIHKHAQYFIESYVRENKWKDIEFFVHEYDKIFDPLIRAIVYQQIIIAIYNNNGSSDLAILCTEKVLKDLLSEEFEYSLQEFLTIIRGLDERLYQHALHYLNK
jgi:tetratricopeptide (TPR) repeat protein